MDLAQARAIFDSAHEAFISMDAAGLITYWNPQAEITFGWSREEAIGRVLAETVIPPQHREAHHHGLARFLLTGEGPALNRRIEVTALHRDGREFPVELTISPLRSNEGWSFHAFLHDISERKQADRERNELLGRVEAIARTDELTGLPNRRAWQEEIRRELERARRQGYSVSVALIDLDRFKAFNDEHGHQAGDQLLKEVAAGWRLALRVTDFVSRYGGEEFAVLLPSCPPRDARAVVERLRAAMPTGQTCSIGLACWDGSESADALLGRADTALYEAKRGGRDQTVVAT